jgi:phosphoserine phosphatase RsbX
MTWAVCERPMPGESVNGDTYVVATRGGRVLVAVIDGLGHGPGAAEAATVARETIEENAAEPLEPLLVLCHRALRRTRGATMTLAGIDSAGGTLEWVGVGNVEGAVLRRRADGISVDSVFNYPGVVGYRLPKVQVRRVELAVGDLLVLATDGVSPQFLAEPVALRDVEPLAARILEDHGRTSDDALVLVGRYEGTGGAD